MKILFFAGNGRIASYKNSNLKNKLSIRKSQLPNAGEGLFTQNAIAKGEQIVEYKGKLVRWVEIKKDDGYNGYILRLNRTMAVNALPTKRALGRYANDASGIRRVKGIKNNAEYVVDGNKCFLEATRNINKGEEIFVGYGKEYWTLIKKLFY